MREPMVTLGCDSCHYIARVPTAEAGAHRDCYNGHGPLVKRDPQLGRLPVAPGKSWAAERDSFIVGVAIIWHGFLYTLPKPYRHCHVISMIHELTGDMNIMGESGFVDQHGAFLGRKAAKEVAVRMGQISGEAPDLEDLYSENLW